MLSAFLASLSLAGNDVVLKYLLGKLRLPLKYYLPYVFLFLTLISAVALRIDSEILPGAFGLGFLALFAVMIAVAALWNVLVAESLQTESLSEYELILLMTPLVTIILAAIFLPAERNIHVFMAGIVASLALVATRIRKHHLVFSKSAKRTMMAVILMSIESIVLAKLLEAYAPPVLYFARVFVIGIVFFYIYRPDTNVFKHRDATTGLVLAAILGSLLMILKYYAFRSIGVTETTIILLLGPILTYLASYFYFHERRDFRRNLVGAGVISACIIYSLLLK